MPAMLQSGTAEAVAYSLMLDVMIAEGRTPGGVGDHSADREYILGVYAECLKAANGTRPSGQPVPSVASSPAVAGEARPAALVHGP